MVGCDLKSLYVGDEEIAQWLRAYVALAKVPSLIPRTYTYKEAHSHP